MVGTIGSSPAGTDFVRHRSGRSWQKNNSPKPEGISYVQDLGYFFPHLIPAMTFEKSFMELLRVFSFVSIRTKRYIFSVAFFPLQQVIFRNNFIVKFSVLTYLYLLMN